VITAEGGSILKEMLFGSTTMHLIRNCPCPVWVIKPGQPKQYGPILAAVDATATDAERDELNTSIVDAAASLARMQQSELLIIHTWTMCGESLLRRRRGMLLKEEVDEIVRQTRDTHRQALTELLRRHPLADLKHQVYLLKGEAGTLIPELAKKKEVELIVMGTLSRSGVAGLLVGHTIEKVLHQVDCSLLIVKPEAVLIPMT
jgi:nucleotide-binding universal stress UspA family protein